MNSLASSGLITMDEASCIEATEAGRLMSIFYLDLETMKIIMKINGTETLERLLCVICECHELADMHLRVDERRCLNTLNRNNAAATIRFPMKGKISTRQMKLNCIIQAILGCLNIPDPSLNQEAMKVMRIADRICKCLVAYLTRPPLISQQPKYYTAVLNSLILAKCITAHLWENSPYVSKQLKGIGPTFSTLLASAGKVNIMLLEESHPRDLERIMNKGPPAGNVIRKQISLLPKYQVTMTPIDEKSVTVQLALLNQNYLSENMEQLTAGDSHKSYIVVGDSDNNLLLLSSFRDKQLISVYDGVINHRITRKHSFEHKVFAHCISSNFVGIDAQCEYLFKDLKSVYSPHLIAKEDFVGTPVNIETNKTDTYKERKRKSTLDNDITQSKEKKKRENTLMTKLKSLRESFGKTSRELKDHLSKSAITSNKILQDFTQSKNSALLTETVLEQAYEIDNNSALPLVNPNDMPVIDLTNVTDFKQMENREYVEMDDEKINGILAEIENEILNCNKDVDLPCVNFQVHENRPSVQNSTEKYQRKRNAGHLSMNLKNSKKCFKKNIKSNYSFLEHKNIMQSDDEDEHFMKNESKLSDDIQKNLEKYIQQTTNTINNKTSSTTIFLKDKECEKQQDKFSDMAARQTESKLEDLNPTVGSVTIQQTDIMGSIEECNSKDIKNIDELEADTIKKILINYEFDTRQTQDCDTNQIVLETIDNCIAVTDNLLHDNDDLSTKSATREVELKNLCQNTIVSELNRQNIIRAKNNTDVLELNITGNNTLDEKKEDTEPFTSQDNFEIRQFNQYDTNRTLKEVGHLSLGLNAKLTKDTIQSDRQCNNKYVYINTALSTHNANTLKIKNKNNMLKQKEVCLDKAELFDDVIDVDNCITLTKSSSVNFNRNTSPESNRIGLIVQECDLNNVVDKVPTNKTGLQAKGNFSLMKRTEKDLDRSDTFHKDEINNIRFSNVENSTQNPEETIKTVMRNKRIMEPINHSFDLTSLCRKKLSDIHGSELPKNIESFCDFNSTNPVTNINLNTISHPLFQTPCSIRLKDVIDGKATCKLNSETDTDRINIDREAYSHNQNIKRYSYSATKVDVATRDDNVTVIKKMKLDLDITEIHGQPYADDNNCQDIKNRRGYDYHNCDKIESLNSKITKFQEMELNSQNKKYYTAINPYKQSANNININNPQHWVNYSKLNEIIKEDDSLSAYNKFQDNTYDDYKLHNFKTNPNAICIGFDAQPITKHINKKTNSIDMAYNTNENSNYGQSSEEKKVEEKLEVKYIEFPTSNLELKIDDKQRSKHNNNEFDDEKNIKRILDELIDLGTDDELEINNKDETVSVNYNHVLHQMTDDFKNKPINQNRVSLSSLPSENFTKVPLKCNSQVNLRNSKIDDTLNKSDIKKEKSQKEKNQLGCILQKYSKILKKDDLETLSQTSTPSKNIFGNYRDCNHIEKSKKPFKITDIHNMKTPLLKLELSKINKQKNLHETCYPAPINENKNYKDQNEGPTYKDKFYIDAIPLYSEPLLLNKEFDQSSLVSIEQNEEVMDSMENELSKLNVQDAIIEELEPCRDTDFNINQSMFNPKNLLLCISKDESDVLVPPPPEFSDETELNLPSCDGTATDCDELIPAHWENNYDNSSDTNFQDQSQMELTPEKDIETWTLSQNYENDFEFTTNFNSGQSFTTMHTPRQRDRLFVNASTSRQKLEHFKFSRKKTLHH